VGGIYDGRMSFSRGTSIPSIVTALVCSVLPGIVTDVRAQDPNSTRTHRPVTLSVGEPGCFLTVGTLEQTRSWAPISTWSAPEFSHTDDPSSWNLFTPAPLPPGTPGHHPLLGAPLAYPLAPIRNTRNRLYADGIKIDLYDLLVYQRVTRTIDDAEPDSLFNRFDLSVHFRTWEMPDQGSGILTFAFRATNDVLDTPPPSEAVGAFSPLDVVASRTSFLIKRLEFTQGFVDDRVSLTIGRGNPNDCIASNLYAWDETRQFMAATFDGGNYPVGYSGYLPIVSLQVIPRDGLYLTGAVTSGRSLPDQLFTTIGDGLYWCAGEVGAVIQAGDENLQGRYSVTLMNSNTGNETVDRSTRVSGNAMALVAQQQISNTAAVWSQYLLSSGEIGPAEQEFTLGLSIENLPGRADDGFGIAVGWSRPSDSAYPGWRERLQLETYYRLQLTESLQLSPDFQVLSRPADPSAEDRPVYAFGLRLLTTF